MTRPASHDATIPRHLGDGLVLRRAARQDAGALVEFNSQIHRMDDSDQPDERVAVWTRDLAERPHPTFDVGDFTLVEDTRAGKIVSSLNLISQTWSYGGIPFGVGRPELVGTLPEYRHRGLVRAQFDVIHRWSEQRGHMLQAITGIPYYYRLFGYEMALDLGGGRIGYKPHIPRRKEGEEEPYRLRPAGAEDVPLIARLYARASKRYLVAAVWDEDLWRYELLGKSEQNVNRRELRIIESKSGEAVGLLSHSPWLWGPTIGVGGYELEPGVSYAAVTPTVLRYLAETGESFALRDEKAEFGAFAFWLGRQHPVYQAISERLPRLRKPYAWYLRVPDLQAFIRHTTTVFESRLASSPLAGHTGELKITFYRRGLRLVFEDGQIKEVETWSPEPKAESGDAGFPGLTFLQLLFGYRSLEELEYAFADCWVKADDARALLDILFPKQASDVWAIS